MKKLKIELQHCYGIKSLKSKIDFSSGRACAIYAANGAMKSSLANTFQDIINGDQSRDLIFPNRSSLRKIVDESSAPLDGRNIFVIRPYDEQFGSTKTSTLLVNAGLREEYTRLFADIESARSLFLKAMKGVSKSKKDLEREIALCFAKTTDDFFIALIRIQDELSLQKDSPFTEIPYDLIYDDKVLEFLATKDFKTILAEYVQKYDELLAASTYFKRGTFTYYNAENIAKSLADNGFFDARHMLLLDADKKTEIKTVDDLKRLIEEEKEQITNDPRLKSKFAEIEKQLYRNASMRDFLAYIQDHLDLLPFLVNVEKFKEDIWKSYIKSNYDLYQDVVNLYKSAEQRKREIEKSASSERTQWEDVVDIFNNRFFVPFKLTIKNRVPVILGQDPIASLEFTFEDRTESAPVQRDDLLKVLSTGEKKAFYILNIIFEVEARRQSAQSTLFVVDDIADSFDYKNKYAIIEYLRDMTKVPHFTQLILTHNFDFFRTVQSRFVGYSNCLMAVKTDTEITLTQAVGIKNIFVNDWKPQFFKSPKKRIASIPFVRNMIEYTRGIDDPDYITLTSLLHRKPDSENILQRDLDAIYNRLFLDSKRSPDESEPVLNVIAKAADECLHDAHGLNFENKIVLSIAIRLAAEKFMIDAINDTAFVTSITANQTVTLCEKYAEKFSKENKIIGILQRVVLMTPESIHINSFMYEPIMDMSDEHLRKLLLDLIAVAKGNP